MTATCTAPAEITETAWHRARRASTVTAWHNDVAGETFQIPDAGSYLRVNDRHFHIAGANGLSHAEICALVGRSRAWRSGLEYTADVGDGIDPAYSLACAEPEGRR